MQKIHIELTNLTPAATDRLIDMLYSYMTNEPDTIFLEIRDLGKCCITIPAGREASLCIPFDAILYVTSDCHWSVMKLASGSRRFRINYSEIKRRLPGTQFLECSRGVLLNLHHVQCAEKDRFLMNDGASFPIRRKGRREILLRWEQYCLDSLHSP